MQYLVSVNACIVAEWNGDPQDLAENIYAQASEIAYSEEHLLQLEVAPVPIPSETNALLLPSARDDSDTEEGGQEGVS
jgi:hypothetical protein